MKNCIENVEQVFGIISISWLFPIPPNLTTDGTDFPQYGKQMDDLLNPLHFAI